MPSTYTGSTNDRATEKVSSRSCSMSHDRMPRQQTSLRPTPSARPLVSASALLRHPTAVLTLTAEKILEERGLARQASTVGEGCDLLYAFHEGGHAAMATILLGRPIVS